MRELDATLISEHAGFVRAVARRLVRDETAVDDIVQETWVTTMERPPRSKATIRSWLYQVVQNLVRQDWRSRERREALEARKASQEACDAGQSLEQIETGRILLEAIGSLSKPYRDALVLRYYEDCPPREIAKRLDMPLETVKSHLKRGLAQLRSRLDSKFGGDRHAWVSGLSMFLQTRRPFSNAAPQAGAAVGSASTIGLALPLKVAACAVLLLGFLFLWWQRETSREDDRLVASTDSSVTTKFQTVNTPSVVPPAWTPIVDVGGVEESESSEEPDDESAMELREPVAETVVHGTLVVMDREGNEHGLESGSVNLFVQMSGERQLSTKRVDVKQGRFVVKIPDLASIMVTDGVLGGRRARVPTPLEHIELAEDDTCVIRLFWMGPTVLHVRDAESGLPLEQIEVRRAPENVSEWLADVKTSIGVSIEGSRSSPILVPPRGYLQGRTIFVRSPGYSWGQLLLDDGGGERSVDLFRTGGVLLSLEHDKSTPEAVLRVYETNEFFLKWYEMLAELHAAIVDVMAEGGQVNATEIIGRVRRTSPEYSDYLDRFASFFEDEPDASEWRMGSVLNGDPTGKLVHEERVGEQIHAFVKGVRRGLFLARIELDREGVPRTVLARCVGEVPEQGYGEGVLTWKHPGPPPRGRIRGSFSFDNSWDSCMGENGDETVPEVYVWFMGQAERFALRRRSVEITMTELAFDAVHCDWRSGEIHPGWYRVVTRPFGIEKEVEVRADEEVICDLQVPTAAAVALTIVDAQDGNAAELDELNWKLVDGGGETVRRAQESADFRFCVPTGRVRFFHRGRDSWFDQEVVIEAGENRITIEMRPTQKIELEFKSGAISAPVLERHVFVESLDSRHRGRCWDRDRVVHVSVPEPGTYRVKVAPIEDYYYIEPFLIEVTEGMTVKRTIEMHPIH